jgi:hypothetical protein
VPYYNRHSPPQIALRLISMAALPSTSSPLGVAGRAARVVGAALDTAIARRAGRSLPGLDVAVRVQPPPAASPRFALAPLGRHEVPGHTAFLVLTALAGGPYHGYGIVGEGDRTVRRPVALKIRDQARSPRSILSAVARDSIVK